MDTADDHDEIHVIKIEDKIITITCDPLGEGKPGVIDIAIHPRESDGYHVAMRLDGQWRYVSFVSQDVRTHLDARSVEDF